MNTLHLRAILWIRWRILINRIRRGGKVGNALFALLVLLGSLVAAGSFALALKLGLKLLPEARPVEVMLAWLGLSLSFLFAWTIGLITDLQRSDAMSFKNLLHLPVSLGWVFLYNYLSSFVSLSMLIFLPPMLGLSLAAMLVHGPRLAIGLALVAAFMSMVTAVTYQFRGWLARMMEDKRKGRNIVAALTIGFVLLAQVPNLINIGWLNSDSGGAGSITFESLDSADPSRNADGSHKALVPLGEDLPAQNDSIENAVITAASLLPPGWLAVGFLGALDGSLLSSGAFLAAMLMLAGLSLRLSFRKTHAAVVGLETSKTKQAEQSLPQQAPEARVSKRSMLEWRLPYFNEVENGLAFASMRSMLRAPEAKMLLLSPLMLICLFGLMLARNPALDQMLILAPMVTLGAVSMALLSVIQLMQNQFGLDREGFRAFVLSPAERYQILRGKNLGTAPVALGVGLIALIGVQIFVPVDFSHFLGGLVQLVSGYLILCLLGNVISIYAPMRLRGQGMRATGAKFQTIVAQFLSIFAMPVILAPLLIPFVAELILRNRHWGEGLPIYLGLHLLILLAVWAGYNWLVRRQGSLLQEREQRILEILTRGA